MKSLILVLVLFCSAAIYADTPDPAVIQLTEKHDTDVKALNEKRDALVKVPREAYIVALNEVEATARTAGRTTEVDAIAAERAAFEKHTFAATNPGLSPRLASLRAKYLAAYAQAQRQFQPPIDALNAAYVASLTTMETTARKDGKEAIAKQAAAAKAKFLGVPEDNKKTATAKTDPKAGKNDKPATPPKPAPAGQPLVPNGDFSERDSSDREHAAAWKYTRGKSVSLMTENGNSFMRLDSAAGESSGFNQKVPLPTNVHNLKVTLRARISQLELNREESGAPKGRPAFFGWVQDASGANLKGFIIHLDRITKGWETFDASCSVPAGGTQLSLTGELMKSKGVVDIDDVKVAPGE